MREMVTEETKTPMMGCECTFGCSAHENPKTGEDETASAPLMFLVIRDGRELAVCPTCTHVATDLVVARLYNGVMDLQPFMKWDVSRVVKLFDLFRFSLPVEAAYRDAPERFTAEATKTRDAIRAMVTGALTAVQATAAEPVAQQQKEVKGSGPLGFLAPSKISKFGES